MDTVGVCELANRASAVLEQLEETGRPVLVTRHGRSIAVLSAIDEEAFHDYVLGSAPEFVRDRSEAEERWVRGEQDGTLLEDVIAEFDREQGPAGGT
jgi:prevent-host-death family protein